MCRQDIPPDYLDKPQLVEQIGLEKESVSFDDGYQWFYEGRNGKFLIQLFKLNCITLHVSSVIRYNQPE